MGKLLGDRASRIYVSLQQATESQRRARELEQETNRLLQQARVEADNIVAAAHRAAESQRETLAEQGRRDSANLVRRARDVVGRERQAAIDELRREVGRIAVLAATHVVREALDARASHDIADRTIADVGRVG